MTRINTFYYFTQFVDEKKKNPYIYIYIYIHMYIVEIINIELKFVI